MNKNILVSGSLLRNTYRINKHLASGGFGNTYVATNLDFDEIVAIKEFFMKDSMERDETTSEVSVSNADMATTVEEQREKFRKEARRLRKLHNDHIVRVHDLFDENGTTYYVMDYVDGENLSERMKRTGKPLTEKEVMDLLPQILDALKSVHDAGLWHLDMKPSNIMVDSRGQVKLIDFGASKQLNAQTGGAASTSNIARTDHYAPIEQLDGNYSKLGPWSDIYSLGATLFSLLTKQTPPTPSQIIDDETADKSVALPMPSSVSKQMRNLILWMMNTNRTKRPQSIEEIQQEIAHDTYRKNTASYKFGEMENDKGYTSEETIINSKNNTKKEADIEEDVDSLNTGEDSKGFVKFIFSFEGRIKRLEYIMTFIVYYVILCSFEFISPNLAVADEPVESLIWLVVFFVLSWVIIAQGAKRCHDRNNSGWYQIIPLYFLWMIFAEGDVGKNNYGNEGRSLFR